MNKIILLLPIILTVSCASNPILIDEEKQNLPPQEKATQIEPAPIETVKDFEKRNTLERVDTNFSTEDIEVFEDVELIGSGVRTYSSEYAKQIIKTEVAANDNLTFIIYFDFDSNELSADAQATLSMHQEIIKKYPDLRLRLEGHTDPKGSREYNLALGELRAIAVKNVLSDQATHVSFGEEKIVSSDDAKNRRVEIIYK